MHCRRPGLCHREALLAIAVLAIAALPVRRAAAVEAPQTGVFGSVDQAAGTITLAAPKTLKLPADPALSPATLGTFSKGDRIRFTVSADGKSLASIEKSALSVPGWQRIVAMLIPFAALLGIGLVGSGFDLRQLILGADKRYSNSKTQLALWSTTAFTAYLATLLLRVWVTGDLHYIGGVGLTGNLLALSGLSALTFAGAKAVTTQKLATAKVAAKEPNRNPPNLIRDLFQNDTGDTDIGDFQMILISAIAAVIYLISTYTFLGRIELSGNVTLPDVDTTLLGAFGVGQGAYLTKKAASNLGEG